MIGMRADVQRLFFDTKAVEAATTRAERRFLSRFGAFVRREARQSIRTRKAVSDPGKPPTNRTGDLKRNIFFAFDPERRSVVIGPVLLPGKRGNAPELLEHGGQARGEGMMTVTEAPGRGAGGRFVSRKRKVRVQGTMTYKARPFMRPAFAKELPKLPAMMQDSIQ